MNSRRYALGLTAIFCMISNVTQVYQLKSGSYVLIAPRVFITDSDHIVDEAAEKSSRMKIRFSSAPVVIEQNCWLGINVVVLKGVRIGHHSVVGAGSVVTRDVPPFSTVVGVPAKVVKRKNA